MCAGVRQPAFAAVAKELSTFKGTMLPNLSAVVFSGLVRKILLPSVLLANIFGAAFAEADTDFWPEIQFYHRLNEQFRIRLLTGFTRSQLFGTKSDGFVEGDLDIGLRDIRKFRRQTDDHKGKYLSMRLGYSYHFQSPPEQRAIVELTSRVLLPGQVLISDRNRLDLRFIDGDDSHRYRNRIRAERDSRIDRFRFSPYVQLELYYDSRVNGWNRNEYSLGSEFPIRHRFILEFYYTYQNNRGPGTSDVNGLATVFQIHW